jgi:hypothetical protein
MSASLTLGRVETFFERVFMIHHPAGHLYADERVGRDPPEAIERSLAFLTGEG